MTQSEPDYVMIDGHRVDPAKADRFYHGDGRRVTDEEWDEDRRRAILAQEGILAVPFELSDTPPPDRTYDDEEPADG